MSVIEDPVRGFFDKTMTERERAIFEGGIALGTIYHQFLGIPISNNPDVIRALKKAVERCIKLQPYRSRVVVKISKRAISKALGPYKYCSLTSDQLNVKVETRYGKADAIVRLRYIPELKYSLMYVEKLSP